MFLFETQFVLEIDETFASFVMDDAYHPFRLHAHLSCTSVSDLFIYKKSFESFKYIF